MTFKKKKIEPVKVDKLETEAEAAVFIETLPEEKAIIIEEISAPEIVLEIEQTFETIFDEPVVMPEIEQKIEIEVAAESTPTVAPEIIVEKDQKIAQPAQKIRKDNKPERILKYEILLRARHPNLSDAKIKELIKSHFG